MSGEDARILLRGLGPQRRLQKPPPRNAAALLGPPLAGMQRGGTERSEINGAAQRRHDNKIGGEAAPWEAAPASASAAGGPTEICAAGTSPPANDRTAACGTESRERSDPSTMERSDLPFLHD